MKKTFEETMYRLMRSNEKLVALVADSGTGKPYEDIARDFPERYVDFGIAECNMCGAAAGLARDGFIPVVFDINSFITFRAYEFVRNDVCVTNLNVKFVGFGAGVIFNTHGPTHHTTEDIAALRVLPNLTLISPASPKEVPGILEKSIAHNGPVYIRLGKAFETEIHEGVPPPFEIGKANILRAGTDISIIATGSIIAGALEAAETLQGDGISVEVINMSTIKPLDTAAVIASARKTGKVLTLEEHQIAGGLGGAVSETLCGSGIPLSFERMGFNDVFCTDYGYHRELKAMYGLDAVHIADKCREMCKRGMRYE